MEMISSVQNSLVKHLVKLRTNHDFRKETGSVLLEGATLIKEVCRDQEPIRLLVSHPEAIPKELKRFPYQLTTEEVIKKIAGSLHPEGIVAEVKLPPPAPFQSLKKLLVLDKISDPGNLGTLLRTALAFAWDGVFLIKGGCDPFNDKTLRASKGALFRLPYREGSWQEASEWISKFHLTPYAADLAGQSIGSIDQKAPLAMVLGNESQGISDEIKEACTCVTIPMRGAMESLNVAVAGGIIMHRLSEEVLS